MKIDVGRWQRIGKLENGDIFPFQSSLWVATGEMCETNRACIDMQSGAYAELPIYIEVYTPRDMGKKAFYLKTFGDEQHFLPLHMIKAGDLFLFNDEVWLASDRVKSEEGLKKQFCFGLKSGMSCFFNQKNIFQVFKECVLGMSRG